MQFGKVPPQDNDLEEMILNMMLSSQGVVNDITGFITPQSFYREAHAIIAESIFGLSARSEPISIISVTLDLRKRGLLDSVGGPYFVTTLTNKISPPADKAEFYSRKLKELEIKRSVIQFSQECVSKAFENDSDPFEIIASQEQFLQSINDSIAGARKQKPWNELLKDVVRNHDFAAQHKHTQGIPSELGFLNHYLGGYQDSDLIIVAARPGSGKTSFMGGEILHAAKMGIPVGVFSLEMSTAQIVNRLVAGESEINGKIIQKGKLDEGGMIRLNHSLGRMHGLPVYIDDTPALNIFEIKARARRMKNKYGIGFIAIDYLQLVHADVGRNGNREQEVSAVSRGLKALAKELNIPVMALAQLSRASEKRGGNSLPILSDLRESGSIEQDADVVMFIHRPELYGITSTESGDSTEGKAIFVVAKNRNGDTDNATVGFKKEITKFYNL